MFVSRPDPHLADEYFLIAHDPHTGAARVDRAIVDLGLATCLLAELQLHGKIDINPDRHELDVRNPYLPNDEVTEKLLQQMAAHRTVTAVGLWLGHIATNAHSTVLQRLIALGIMEQRHVHKMLRRPTITHALTERLIADIPAIRIQGRFVRGDIMGSHDRMLLLIADITGLFPVILPEAVGQRHKYLKHLLVGMPPGLHTLIAELRLAIAHRPTTPKHGKRNTHRNS